MKIKDEKEWLKQAEYDFDTAQTNLDARRYIFAIFMCHLSLEKALKAFYFLKLKKEPPRTHDLTYLIHVTNLEMPDDMFNFVDGLSTLSVPTRYPDDLDRILKKFDDRKTSETLDNGKEVLKWIKTRLLSEK